MICKLFHPPVETWVHTYESHKVFTNYIQATYKAYCPTCSNTKLVIKNFMYDNEYIMFTEALEKAKGFR